MKRIYEISIIFIVLTVIISYNKLPKEGHTCNLTVICDSTFNEHIYENVYLISNSDTIYVKGRNYRQGKKGIKIKLDSLPSKEYILCLENMFREVQSQKVNLMNDTVISISNRHRYENIKIIPLADLENADTIKFIYSLSGCISHVESFNLIRKDSYYLFEPIRIQSGNRLMLTRYVSKTVSNKIVNGLFDLELNSRKYMISIRNKTPWQTNRVEYYILVNKRIFMFDDENRCCEEYTKFEKIYIDKKK